MITNSITNSIAELGKVVTIQGPYLGVWGTLSGLSGCAEDPSWVCRGPYLDYLGVQGSLSGCAGDPI